jgi:hypothetical protein
LNPDSGMPSRLDAFSNRRLGIFVACIGFVLVLPSLTVGLQVLDDAPQRDFILAHLRGDASVQHRPWYDIYNLVDGNPVHGMVASFSWLTPWWSWPALKVHFFRPVSAATLYFDYAVFGDHYWLTHLHSIVWYGAACCLVTLVLLQISRSRATALLGAVLFAVDDAHATAASWLAGRNALIGVSCFAGALSLYVLAARRQQRRWVIAAAVCLVVGLLAAENVVSALPFFVAYSLLLDRRPFAQKILDPLIVCSSVAAWFLVHKLLGFGTLGSGAYLDPIADSAALERALPGRYLHLLRIQFGPPWALLPRLPFSWVDGIESFNRWIVLPALAVFVIRRADRDREIVFWAVSGTLGLLPLTTALPHDRLLTHVGPAWFMLLAYLIVATLQSARQASRKLRYGMYAFVAIVLALHVGLSSVALAVGSNPEHPPGQASLTLDTERAWWTREVLVIQAPSLLTMYMLNWERSRLNLQRPQRIAALGVTDQEVEVMRLDANTFELYCPHGYLLEAFATFWRGPSVPFRLNDVVRVQDYSVTILRLTPDGRPLRLRFQFARSLDDPSFFFIYWTGERFAPFRFGPVGQRRVIRAPFDFMPLPAEEQL